MNVTKLHKVTKQRSYIGQIAAGSCNLVTKLQLCLFLHSDIKVHEGRHWRGAAPDKTPTMAARRRLLFFKIKVRPGSCRSYPIWRPCIYSEKATKFCEIFLLLLTV
jgi:hypothetical protein